MGLRDRRSPRLSRTLLVNTARLVWITLLIWGEIGVFFWSLSSCRWPKLAGSRDITHVMLISDAQVRHPSAFRQETSWIGFIRQVIFDLNLKKAWHVTARLNPHVVIFLGDMTAHGKHTRSLAEFKDYWLKFQSIFHLKSETQMYFLPGNNDVGMGVSSSLSNSVRSFYNESFGPFNQRLVIRGHTFVCLDAPDLVDEDYQRSAQGVPFEYWNPVPGGTVEFIKSVSASIKSLDYESSRTHPLILLTHIPLSRPDTASCGPLREKGNIRRSVGHGYQTTFGKQTSAFLLDALRPSAIFSGDNRDYCEYIHTVSPGGTDHELTTKEITTKSFSLANQIRRPGFQLLTLTEPIEPSSSPHQTFTDTPCFLPDQYYIYENLYQNFALVTLLVLFAFNLRRARRLRGSIPSHISFPPRSTSPSRSLSRDSRVWSPFTPPLPSSPLGSLPASIRTPNPQSGPTLRAASRPATPLASPLLSPMIYSHEEEEEEVIYPVQYATGGLHLDEESWLSENGISNNNSADESFVSLPGSKTHPWQWSWTFSFGSKRRRMTIHAPTFSWTAFKDLVGLFPDLEMSFRRRGVLKSTFLDGLSIAWFVLCFWGLINWWFF